MRSREAVATNGSTPPSVDFLPAPRLDVSRAIACLAEQWLRRSHTSLPQPASPDSPLKSA